MATTTTRSHSYKLSTVYTPWTGIPNLTGYSGKVLTKDTRVGSVVPAWRALIEMGLDAGSPYSRVLGPRIKSKASDWRWRFLEFHPNKYIWVPCSYRAMGDRALHHLSGHLPSAAPDVDTIALERRAVIAFLNKVREEITPFKALPFLGELRETVRMIRHPLAGIRKHTRRYNRRANAHSLLKKAGHVADALADSYLQWTYGVNPLIGDIEGAVAAFKKLCSTDVKPIPISVTFKETTQKPRYSPGVMYYEYGARSLFTVVQTDTVRLQIKGAIRSDVLHPIEKRVATNIGATLEEFVPTLWELLPYSFLIDYFTNVGDILGAKAVALADLAWYWQSTKVKTKYTGIAVPLPWSYPNRPALSSPFPLPSVADAEYVSFNRKKPSLGVDFSKTFEFNLPTVGQWINATVLTFAKMRG